jgi:predicted small integral membrane protein
MAMIAIRAAKAATVAAIALFASLVTFGNLTDYNTNFVFVEHVLAMDTIFPFSTIKYRAITSPAFAHAAYALIIAAEAATAVLCWIGAAALACRLRADAGAFNRAKSFAVAGLTLGSCCGRSGSCRSECGSRSSGTACRARSASSSPSWPC